MKKHFIYFAFLFLNLFVSAQVAGTLDTAFGIKGRTSPVFSNGNNFAGSIVTQPDGKIIVVGRYAQIPPQGTIFFDSSYFQLVRYNTNGTIDNSFGINGRVISTFNGAFGYSIALQKDGKILVGGSLDFSGFLLSRFNSDGSVDTTFNEKGYATIFINASITDIKVQSDNKILVVGIYSNTTSALERIAVVRFNSDGTLDNLFGNGGRIITNSTKNKSIRIRSIVTQSDNKIVVCGLQYVNVFGNFTQQEIILLRYNIDGNIDSTFATNGIFSLENSNARALKILSNKKILIAGSVETDSITKNNAFALFQFNENGQLDNSFGDKGKITTQVLSNCFASDMIVQKDGKILLIGGLYEDDYNNTNFLMARYTTNGTSDATFGIKGELILKSPSFESSYYKGSLQLDGKIIVLTTVNNAYRYNFSLSKYYLTDSQVGIQKIDEQDKSILIFPNPISNQLNIKFEKQLYNPSQLKIVDLMGRIVYDKTYDSILDYSISLNTDFLSAGSYVLLVCADNHITSKKFIKM